MVSVSVSKVQRLLLLLLAVGSNCEKLVWRFVSSTFGLESLEAFQTCHVEGFQWLISVILLFQRGVCVCKDCEKMTKSDCQRDLRSSFGWICCKIFRDERIYDSFLLHTVVLACLHLERNGPTGATAAPPLACETWRIDICKNDNAMFHFGTSMARVP
jgi:hypothetical protein